MFKRERERERDRDFKIIFKSMAASVEKSNWWDSNRFLGVIESVDLEDPWWLPCPFAPFPLRIGGTSMGAPMAESR